MMNCKDAQRQLSDWLDNVLTPRQSQALEQHIQSCPACAEQRRQMQRVRQLLALKRYEQPDPIYMRGMLSEFHRRLEAQKSARRAVRWAGLNTDGLRRWIERTHRVLRTHPLIALRYGMATAFLTVLALNAFLLAAQFRHSKPTVTALIPDQEIDAPTYMLERLSVNGGNEAVPF